MKACVCVDYLSHEWTSTDLIQAHIELKRQKSKNRFTQLKEEESVKTPKELKKLSLEKTRQTRYQNAIWRQMARSCTKKLSSSNQMIHPSIVNWQKESDVTWLYGPLYMPPESSSDLVTHPSLSFTSTKKKVQPTKSTLKPVLKKNHSSFSTNIMLQKDYWTTSTTNTRYWSKCASDSGKQNGCVKFNPNITEVKFLPETPVKESLFNSQQREKSYFSIDSEGEEDEEEEDDEEDIWTVLFQVGSYFKSVLFTSLFTPRKKISSSSVIKSNKNQLFNFELIQFCVSSAVSFTAWIMYQTLSTLMKRATPSRLRRRSNLLTTTTTKDNTVTA